MHGSRAFSRAFGVSVVLLLAAGAGAGAAVGERELAETLAAGLRDGTVEWMTVGSDRFPVVVREAEREQAAGVVLIVPEPGAHADWPEVVRPLRLGLAAHGWQTVAIQMPRAAPNGDFADPARAASRLGFLIESLVAGDVERIVVLAQGRAYGVVLSHLAQALASPPKQLHGLVLVSPTLPPPVAGAVAEDPLVATELPLLELRGSEDRAEVHALLGEHRRRAARGELKAWREVVIDAALSDFRAQDGVLVRRVRGWLSRLPAPADSPSR